MKVFVLAPREDWICDRIKLEWLSLYGSITTENPAEADVLWLLAAWCWNHIPENVLLEKTVIATIHHIVPDKFTQQKYAEFLYRDKFVNAYHVPNNKTKRILEQITKKPIVVTCYWVDESKWCFKNLKKSKAEVGLPHDTYSIGSFQRDTEGSNPKIPKLEKGPDIFCDYVELLNEKLNGNITVLLGGWRRQYVISRLENQNINYKYIELASQPVLNTKYNACDLYIVGSRFEGGPQAVIEAGITRTPIVSTDVGIASEILSPECIFDINNISVYKPVEHDVKLAYNKSKQLSLNAHSKNYISMFEQELKNGK